MSERLGRVVEGITCVDDSTLENTVWPRGLRAVNDHDSLTAHQAETLIGMWPSAEAYRRMLTLGVNTHLDAIRKAADQIPDAVLAEYEPVMRAGAPLGVPVRAFMAARGSGERSWGQVSAHYDDF